METIIDIRKQIHSFIDSADERILRIIKAIIETEEENQSSVPDWFYNELEERRENHLSGKSKSFSWEEVQKRVRKALE
ncbi:MAG: addiction module protein [Weeksellaceae bacterium]